MTPEVATTVPAPSAQEYCTEEYWKAFEKCLQYRIQGAVWKPFNFIKIFKLGLHWVVLVRTPDLSTGQARLTYWVMSTWERALAQASDVATPIRTIFEGAYTRKN